MTAEQRARVHRAVMRRFELADLLPVEGRMVDVVIDAVLEEVAALEAQQR